MRVLVVEDDDYKRDRILRALDQVRGLNVGQMVTSVSNVFDATRFLRENRPEVLILDIALPLTDGGDPEEMAGMELLEEVTRHPDEYGVPTHVIGLTAYQDVFDRCSAKFESRLLSLVMYEAGSGDWESAVAARLSHVLMAEQSSEGYRCDLGIVCALEYPELAAVLNLPWEWSPLQVPGDHSIYYQGRFSSPFGERRAVAASAARKGMPATMALAGKMISLFRPRVLAMPGIAAGVKGKTQLGDVIVADPCWDWGSGKWVRRSGEVVFEPAPFQAHLDPPLRSALASISKDSAALAAIRSSWPAQTPLEALSVRLGPVASGAAVIADQETLNAVVEQHRELLGLEMEGYGVFVAALESGEPRPQALVIKSVVDFANSDKDDRVQPYAAFTSARVLALLAERGL